MIFSMYPKGTRKRSNRAISRVFFSYFPWPKIDLMIEMIRAKIPRGGDSGSCAGIMFFSFSSVIILRGFRSGSEFQGMGTSVPAPVSDEVPEWFRSLSGSAGITFLSPGAG
jgi:hypothetical protein